MYIPYIYMLVRSCRRECALEQGYERVRAAGAVVGGARVRTVRLLRLPVQQRLDDVKRSRAQQQSTALRYRNQPEARLILSVSMLCTMLCVTPGNSWSTAESCSEILQSPLSACVDHPERRAWAEWKCSLLLSERFQPCHTHVSTCTVVLHSLHMYKV